jgi:hypothetical protein
MKSNSLLITSALAAASSIALLPVSPAAAGIVFIVAALLALGAPDLGRSITPLAPRAEVVPFSPALAGLRRAA